jgi:hypothetical protein
MDDNTNPGSPRFALLLSMLPIIQSHQMLCLSKVLFMQDRATRRGMAVVLRVTTAGSPTLPQLRALTASIHLSLWSIVYIWNPFGLDKFRAQRAT